jgi:D-sedoheptulose 7-phosphate isomerase
LQGGGGGAVHHPLVARSEDPLVVKEVHVTTHHVLWELAHVLFEQPGVLDPEVVG